MIQTIIAQLKTLLLSLSYIIAMEAHAQASVTPSASPIRASLIDFTPTAFSEGGQFKGSYIDVLKALERRTGFTFEVETFPFLRAAERVRAGSADLTIGQLTDATSQIGGRRILVHKYRYLLVTQKTKQFKSVRDVHGLIGRLRGGCSGLLSNKSVTFFEVTRSYEQGFTMLERGRLDGFCGIEEGIAYSLKLMKLDPAKFDTFLIGESDRYIHFSRNFSEVAFRKIEKAVSEMITDGELKTIHQKYVGSNGLPSKVHSNLSVPY